MKRLQSLHAGILLIVAAVVARAAGPNRRVEVEPVKSSLPPINHDLWSFKKPVMPAIPPVRDEKWARTPVDRFILARLDEKGLAPSAPADRRTLIRRATYDLLGLPPTEQEVQAFVADAAPDAYEKLVDRLLASPHYGERWGRYWLDLARYSDTKGYVYAREERQFYHAYNYRDWVIKALNEDMPYDRFLMLQIAADQMGTSDGARFSDDLAAMGFLTVGRRFLGVVTDIVDDRIDVTLRTTEGLTVGCARCHDHKFDPIPTKDYYSLYGVFVGSTEKPVCLDLHPKETEEYRKYVAGLTERTDKLNKSFATRKDALLTRLRNKAGDYLAALPGLAKMPDDNFEQQLGPDDLIPIIIRQWHEYLFQKSKKFDPIWTPWNTLIAIPESEFSAKSPAAIHAMLTDAAHPLNRRIAAALAEEKPASMADVGKMYGKVLTEVSAQWRELAKKSDVKNLPDRDDEALRLVLYGTDSPARVPAGSIADTQWFFEEASRVEFDQLQAEIDRWNIKTAAAPPYALILVDRPEQKNPHVFKRGNPNTPGEEIPRHFLSLIAGAHPPAFSIGSGRLELARDIASRDNPLTARVMVNRIWQHHFGAGLVTTPSDFGNRSDPPSHPQLLDWLATTFMKEGWSIKAMHRLMMCSATYRQQSADVPAAAAIDPENRLLARMNRTRLDFEATRDSLLAASGELDLSAGGRPADITGARRSVYVKVDRQFLPGMERVFDFACPDLHIPQRAATTVPQQALFFMNASFVTARAKALAARPEIAAAPNDAERIQWLYHFVYQRDATPKQVAAGLAFIAATSQATPPAPAPAKIASAWKYGYGEYDSAQDRIGVFTPLPYFDGEAWQGGRSWPDKRLGWVQLTATGGHAGNDLAHAAIRRWIAPAEMTVRITGEIRHEHKEGHGIAARMISSRRGTLGHWTLHHSSANAGVKRLEVKKGETIDFVVDFAGMLHSNDFIWSPVITALNESGAPQPERAWTSTTDFSGHGPAPLSEPMSPWAMYAHVLLMSNEFLFVD